MNGSNRLLGILQLFENHRSVWTVDEISQALGMSVSTAYRHVRDLVKAGFVNPVTGAGYSLGPGFIRYDRIWWDSIAIFCTLASTFNRRPDQ